MLRLEEVRVRFHDQLVLRDVTMTVASSRTTVLIGRNGAGKTTTLRCIMGLLPLEGGRVLFDDLDLATVPVHDRARLGIGYAPEDRRLISDVSVEDNILLPAIALSFPATERKRRLDEVYALLPEIAITRKRAGGGPLRRPRKDRRAWSCADGWHALRSARRAISRTGTCACAFLCDTLARLRGTRPSLGLLITELTPKLLEKIVDSSLLIERGEVTELTKLIESQTAAI